MPVFDINPNNSGSIKLGLTAAPTQEYSCQVTNFKIDPVPNFKPTPETYCAASVNRAGKSGFQITFDYLQDWGAANSISQFMTDNDGVLVFFEFAPDVPDIPVASGSFHVVASSYGGLPGESWTSTGNVGLEGTPVYTAPVATTASASSTE